MRIALDAMGGDHAPAPIVAGAVQAVAADPSLHVVLVGDQAQVEPLVAKESGDRTRIEFFHCTQVIGMEESPVIGLRRKPDNSISRCWQLLAENKVEAIVSAGNTGAMVAGGLRLRRFLKNVDRPGIAMSMPTAKGPCVMIDVGANINPKPEHLYQYGVMGSIFSRHIYQREKPTIGLMNVGSEEAKGHDLAKDTHALFNASTLRDTFIGNIEGRDIHKGACRCRRMRWFCGQRRPEVLRRRFRVCHEAGWPRVVENTANREATGIAGDSKPGQPIRLPRTWRCAAARDRRHLHHLPRQLRRPSDQERLSHGRSLCFFTLKRRHRPRTGSQ